MSIVFEESRDPRLLRQYYELREQCYRKELGLTDFDGSEQDQDRRGRIVLAHQDGQCLGGARISGDLPVQTQLRELDLSPKACCMWERFAMDPALRTVQLIRDFLAQLNEASRVLGYQHGVVLSSLRTARFYRQSFSAIGVGFEIHGSVPECAEGAFAGLEHYLSVAKLQHNHHQLSMAA